MFFLGWVGIESGQPGPTLDYPTRLENPSCLTQKWHDQREPPPQRVAHLPSATGDAILPPKILDRRLQEDWARAAKEGPRVLMNLRVDL